MINEILTGDINTFSVYATSFLFILLRVGIFVTFLPIIGGSQLPPQFRIGLAVFIALLLTPVVKFEIGENHIPMIVVREICLGMGLGFTVRFIFWAVNMAGAFISQTIGMSLATTFNPEMGQSAQISEAYGIIAMLFFLAMNAHHDLIYVFVKSFELLPAGQLDIRLLIPKIVSLGSGLFVVGLKIGAPIMVGSLITYLLSGFLYKAAPQMNIFFIVLPLNIFLGFLLIVLSLPVLEYVLEGQFGDIRNNMMRILMMSRG